MKPFLRPLCLGALLWMIPAASAQQKITLEGTIVGQAAPNTLWMRAYDRYFRVGWRAPWVAGTGTRVRAYGLWKDGRLQTQNWRVLTAAPRVPRVERFVRGPVIHDLPGDEFQIRTGNGSLYRVLALGGQPAELNPEDEVYAEGAVRNGNLLATKVTVVLNRTPVNPPRDYEPRRAIVGTVAGDVAGKQFLLRHAGQTETVRALWNEPQGLRNGVRVRIYARWDAEAGVWQASNIRILSGVDGSIGNAPNLERDYGPQFSPTTWTGTVVALNGADLQLRAPNGRTYPVKLLIGRPGGLYVGTRVLVRGYWKDGMMWVNSIQKAGR